MYAKCISSFFVSLIFVYSKKFNIGCACDLLVISNLNTGFGLIVSSK